MEGAEGSAAKRSLCPRCDYDLAGAVSSWSDSCPVRGTCSECGLEFAWSDIINERLTGPRWSYEHGKLLSVGRLISTMARVVLVPGPWRALRLELVIMPRRLMVVFAGSVVLLHLMLAGAAILEFVDSRMFFVWTVEEVFERLMPIMVWPYGRRIPMFRGSEALTYLAWIGMQWFCMALLMLILDETFRRVRVRRAHLLRGTAYSFVVASAGVAVFLCAASASVLHPAAEALVVVTLIAPTFWLGLWWYSFVKRYLRLPRAGIVVLVHMLVSLLAAVTFLVAEAAYLR